MSNVILINTSTEICKTVSESYKRLTGNYVGPDMGTASIDSGFLIQNGNKQSGLFIANGYSSFYNNNLNFDKCNSDLIIKNYPNTSFYLSGSTSYYQFDANGNVSFGSGINSYYKGIQSYTVNPTLVLTDTGNSFNPSIKFFDKSNYKTFDFGQNSSTGSCFFTVRELTLSTFAYDTINLSGSNVSINSSINKDYNFYVNGSSFFTGKIIASGGITSCGVNCISNVNINTTGLDVSTISLFRNTSVFSGDLNVTGAIRSNQCVVANTGFFTNVSGNGCSTYVSGIYSNLNISGGNCANFNVNSNFNCTSNFNNICSTGYVCAKFITGNNLVITDKLCYYGLALDVRPTGTVTHQICGNCIVICATGASCNVIINGNLVNTGSSSSIGYFNSLNTVCNTLNSLSGCLYSQCCVCSPLITTPIGIGNYISSYSGNFTDLVSASSLKANYINSCGTSFPNTFCADLQVSGNISSTGYVCSINTAKAWGVYSLKCGVPTIITGYNVCNYMTIPITGMRVTGTNNGYGNTGSGTIASKYVWSNPYVFYGIRLCNTVKWPFTFDMKFNPIEVFDKNVYGAGGLATGTGTFGLYSNSSGVYGISGVQVSQPLISTLVNCAGKTTAGNYIVSDFTPLQFNTSYNEVLFNLSPICTNIANYYSIINSSTLNGTGSFVIYSY